MTQCSVVAHQQPINLKIFCKCPDLKNFWELGSDIPENDILFHLYNKQYFCSQLDYRHRVTTISAENTHQSTIKKKYMIRNRQEFAIYNDDFLMAVVQCLNIVHLPGRISNITNVEIRGRKKCLLFYFSGTIENIELEKNYVEENNASKVNDDKHRQIYLFNLFINFRRRILHVSYLLNEFADPNFVFLFFTVCLS